MPTRESTAIFPHQFPAVLTAELADGRRVTERVRANRGGPQRPLSAEELSQKFSANAERAVDADAAQGLVQAAWDMCDGRPVADLTTVLRALFPGAEQIEATAASV